MNTWCPSWNYLKPQRVVLVLGEEPYEVLWRRLHVVVTSMMNAALELYGTAQDIARVLKKNLVLFALGGAQRLSLMTGNFGTADHLLMLEDKCVGARLIFLDPLRQLHRADENDSTSMNALVQLLHGS